VKVALPAVRAILSVRRGTLASEGRLRNTECLACFNCDDVCPANAVSFGFGRKKAPSMDLGRSSSSLALFGALTVPFLR